MIVGILVKLSSYYLNILLDLLEKQDQLVWALVKILILAQRADHWNGTWITCQLFEHVMIG